MRNFIEQLRDNELYEFEATVDNYSWSGPKYRLQKNLCLKNIKMNGKKVESHIWTDEVFPFIDINVKRGDRVSFFASKKYYEKGYEGWKNKGILPKGKRTDCHLSNFQKVRKIKK